MDFSAVKIGFLGAGRMASAMAGGMVKAGLVPAENIAAGDPFESSRLDFAQTVPGAKVFEENEKVASTCDCLIVAVKPYIVPKALDSVQKVLPNNVLIVSIAAGVSLKTIVQHVPKHARLIRAMPNTPCLVGQSATAFALHKTATEEDATLVQALFEAFGEAYRVEEKLLDAVTGLSGSGPAYVFSMIEALSDGGVLAGLPRQLASDLAVQTVLGAATMLRETKEHPALLREQVTSPGGTTAAGLAALEAAGFRAGLLEAVKQATVRANELGNY